MGVNVQLLRMVLHARKQGAKLDRVITIGRLDALLTPTQMEQEFAAFGEQLQPGEAKTLLHTRDRYCEPILERLGARTVDSLDASAYEDANVIHDLNAPIADEHKGKYSLVIDGGTLEHVFNFPEALKSCMSLAEVGGHVILFLPANNEMGHGFYQFSPDLVFRAFFEENGYLLKGVFIAPIYSNEGWLKVANPAVVRQRVGYNSSISALGLLVLAQRVSDVPLFAKPPQQSDYVVAWEGQSEDRLAFFDRATANEHKIGFRRKVRGMIPEKLLHLRRIFNAGRSVASGPDPQQFQPFDPRA